MRYVLSLLDCSNGVPGFLRWPAKTKNDSWLGFWWRNLGRTVCVRTWWRVLLLLYFRRGKSGGPRCLMSKKYHGHGKTGNLSIPKKKKTLLFQLQLLVPVGAT